MSPRLAITLFLVGCLEVPVLERPDAPRTDGARSSFSVAEVTIESFDGQAFDAGEVPRRPRITLSLTAAPDEGLPLYLFAGLAPDELASDLAGAPLREASVAARLEAEVTVAAGRVTLVPIRPLAPGARVLVGLGAWATGQGVRLGAPFVLPLVVSREPSLGAALTDAWPPDRAAGIGPTVPLFALRFDGSVETPAGALVLSGPSGELPAVVRGAPCAEIGWSGEHCLVLSPSSSLAPLAEHHLRADGVRDATGAPLPPLDLVVTTATEARMPVLVPVDCAPDETPLELGCALADDRSVRLRVQGLEPLRFALDTPDGGVRLVAPRGDGTLVLEGLPAEASVPATLRATNAAGLTLIVPFDLATTASLPALSIAEVRADPLGREPTQEYVELWNAGATPILLEGMRLADGLFSEGDMLPPLVLAPGQRALVVASGFDPEDPADGLVPAGVALARVDGSIGSGGLSSSGEPLFLRDAEGRRLSAVPARSVEAGRCLVRIGADLRSPDAAGFVEGPCTPGTAP